MKFRHEWKHELSPGDLICLRGRLSALMRSDPHASGGSYRIRSLYFDNLEDKALREKLEGVKYREKFRLRYYNGDTAFIKLEKKSKSGSLCSKETAPISAEDAAALLSGDTAWMADSAHPLVRELRQKMLTEGLAPRTIVEYVREPFIFDAGNVRVTLDRDLRTGLSPASFLDPDCLLLPPPAGSVILEVKWDEFLPDIIRDAVQLPGRHSAPYSKYAVCRAYG